MTKENQLNLYKHYVALAKNIKKDRNNVDFKPIIRENAKKHAEEIIKSFPEFAKKEEKEIKKTEKK